MVSDRVSIWFSHVLVSHFSGLCSVSNHLFAYFSLVLILHRMKHSWRTDRDPSSQFCQLVMPYMFLLMVNTQVYIYNYLHNIRKSDFVLPWIIFYVLSWFLTGTVYGGLDNPKLTYSQNVKLRPGINKISLLSASVGLPVSFFCLMLILGCLFRWFTDTRNTWKLPFQNVGIHFEKWNAGVLGPVTLKGLNEGTRDLTKQKWSYKVIS